MMQTYVRINYTSTTTYYSTLSQNITETYCI